LVLKTNASLFSHCAVITIFGTGDDVMTIFWYFRQFSAKTNYTFLKNQCYDQILHYSHSFVVSQKRQFFRWIFRRKSLKNRNIGLSTFSKFTNVAWFQEDSSVRDSQGPVRKSFDPHNENQARLCVTLTFRCCFENYVVNFVVNTLVNKENQTKLSKLWDTLTFRCCFDNYVCSEPYYCFLYYLYAIYWMSPSVLSRKWHLNFGPNFDL
jgi:hypothetical protein